ncbi:MAG: lipoprotein-releasing ABC transporter permease subunit [candidate division WOR-3 bacterium]
MNYSFFIALKHLFGARKTFFGYIVTAIAIGGVFIGVAALIVVLSVMNGFQKDVKERIIDVNSHIIVLKYFNEPIENYKEIKDSLKVFDDIVSITPFIYSKGLIQFENWTNGIIIRGFCLEDSVTYKIFKKHLKFGRFPEKDDELILGVDLAEELRVHTGDVVRIATPFGSTETFGSLIPKISEFTITGIFDAGMYQYNAELVYIPLKKASEIFGLKGKVTGLELRIKDIYNAPKVAKKIEKKLGYPYRTNNWIDLNGSLFAALALEKKIMFLLLLLVVIVAAFNIITTLIMVVMEKTTEIGVLKTLGLSEKDILRIYIYQGLIINIIGTISGLILGLFLCFLLSKYKFIDLPGEVYLLDKLPVDVQFWDVIFVLILTSVVSLVSTLYPAYKASKMDPVKAIKYE